MPIILEEEQRGPTTPVVKRTAIGETFIGAIIRAEQRDIVKDGAPVLKADGKPRQELVVHCIALPGCTAPVGKGDVQRPVEPGEECRLILRGGGFGAWIEGRRKHRDNGPLVVGDLIATQVTYGQAYNAAGGLDGGQITDQAQVVALKLRGKTVGLYGPVQLAESRNDEWTTKAEDAYRRATAIVLDLGGGSTQVTQSNTNPFPPTPAAPPAATSAPTSTPQSPAAADLFGTLLG